MDDVGSAAQKYLATLADVVAVVGALSDTDPVLANQGQPYIFYQDLYVRLQGTSSQAIVLAEAGGWSPSSPMSSKRYNRLQLDIWVDALRDAQASITQPAETRQRANRVYSICDHFLHRLDTEAITWGDLLIISSVRLTAPVWNPVPDGDGLIKGTAYYGLETSVAYPPPA